MQSGRDHDAASDAQAPATTTVSIWMGPDPSSERSSSGRREVPRAHIEKAGGLAQFLEANPQCEEYAGQDTGASGGPAVPKPKKTAAETRAERAVLIKAREELEVPPARESREALEARGALESGLASSTHASAEKDQLKGTVLALTDCERRLRQSNERDQKKFIRLAQQGRDAVEGLSVPTWARVQQLGVPEAWFGGFEDEEVCPVCVCV